MSIAASSHAAPKLLGPTTLTVDGGVDLAVFESAAPPSAPTIVLANGLGGPHLAWRSIVAQLGDRYRFVTWDYRGLYASAQRPHAPRFDEASVSVHKQVGDLEAILESRGVTEFALVGWSMGVQVALEAYRAMRSRVRALVLLNGTAGRPLDTVMPHRALRPFVRPVLALGERLRPWAERVMRKGARQPETIRIMKYFGMMADTLDEREFAELTHAFAELDLDVFLKTLKALGDHDASLLLPDIRVPVLVIAGDRDPLTPRGLSVQMARAIPEAEMLVVRGGTHYTAVEYPELVALRMERFLVRAGFG